MYKAHGKEENCALVTGEGGHRFYADDTWPLIHKMSGKQPKTRTRVVKNTVRDEKLNPYLCSKIDGQT